MNRLYAILTSAAVLSGLVGLAYVQIYRSDDPLAQCRQGQIAGGNIGGPFTLVNPAGKTVTEAEVLQKPSLVYFGYTFCPDVCPFDVARNAEAVDILEARGFDVTPVFISIDPERDTPELLRAYLGNFDKSFVALRGTDEETKALAKHFKVFYAKVPGKTEGNYTIDHTAGSYVFDAKGAVRLFTRHGTGADALKSDLQLLLNGR